LIATGLSFSSSSTVTFDGGTQTIPAVTFGYLVLSGSNSKTAGGNITVNGNLTVQSGITLIVNNSQEIIVNGTVTTAGAITNNGTITIQ
jgi:formylmethanofuran dehydrogenase subunit C